MSPYGPTGKALLKEAQERGDVIEVSVLVYGKPFTSATRAGFENRAGQKINAAYAAVARFPGVTYDRGSSGPHGQYHTYLVVRNVVSSFKAEVDRQYFKIRGLRVHFRIPVGATLGQFLDRPEQESHGGSADQAGHFGGGAIGAVRTLKHAVVAAERRLGTKNLRWRRAVNDAILRAGAGNDYAPRRQPYVELLAAEAEKKERKKCLQQILEQEFKGDLPERRPTSHKKMLKLVERLTSDNAEPYLYTLISTHCPDVYAKMMERRERPRVTLPPPVRCYGLEANECEQAPFCEMLPGVEECVWAWAAAHAHSKPRSLRAAPLHRGTKSVEFDDSEVGVGFADFGAAKHVVVRMPASNFLALALPMDTKNEQTYQRNMDTVVRYLKTSYPVLVVNVEKVGLRYGGTVVSHEGRHRALALVHNVGQRVVLPVKLVFQWKVEGEDAPSTGAGIYRLLGAWSNFTPELAYWLAKK